MRFLSCHDYRDLLRRPEVLQSFCDAAGRASEDCFLFEREVADEGDFAARGGVGHCV